MLDSLLIKNFRALEDFRVDKLGRVNLIVGRNNSGKSTVLEALRVYAGGGQRAVLEEIAAEHGERTRVADEEWADPELQIPFQEFFTGRNFPALHDAPILIGSSHAAEQLKILHAFVLDSYERTYNSSGFVTSTKNRIVSITKPSADANKDEVVFDALVISKGERTFPPILPEVEPATHREQSVDPAHTQPYSLVPTQLLDIDDLADLWDRIALTEHEDQVLHALRFIAPDIEKITFVQSHNTSRRSRTAKVKLRGVSRPVPIGSLGDGVQRVLQLVLKAAAAKGGFFLIDEFENGLHYSVQEQVWGLVFELAMKLDMQVFATTHSWDCIESFARVAKARQDVEGVLFRVGRSARTSDQGRIIATVFDEDALYDITQSDVEVR